MEARAGPSHVGKGQGSRRLRVEPAPPPQAARRTRVFQEKEAGEGGREELEGDEEALGGGEGFTGMLLPPRLGEAWYFGATLGR